MDKKERFRKRNIDDYQYRYTADEETGLEKLKKKLNSTVDFHLRDIYVRMPFRDVLISLGFLVLILILISSMAISLLNEQAKDRSRDSGTAAAGKQETAAQTSQKKAAASNPSKILTYPVYTSKKDKDGDGVDDQTDILRNTRKYIASRPKYKSKYYTGGWPTDHYGVCTDLVDYALLHSGYNMRTLIWKDVHRRPSAYPGIDTPDKDIDFRRVENLKVWLDKYAISLTTDINKKEEWQGGDIVVFRSHIGIVSDKRNAQGVPYLIHHNKPGQKHYEQNVLAKRAKKHDIIGHYRIS